MSRAGWLLDVLSDAFRGRSGFRVDYVPGWETRGRDTFDPRGVINHHTGGGSYNALLNYMSTGSSIAPLCNVATSRPENGIVRITIVAAGKANHAGRGYLPWTGTDNGNMYSVGFENQNDGAQAWPRQQDEAIAIANAAVLQYLKVGTDRLADHKTYAPTRKVDRHSVNLQTWMQYVDQVLQGGEDMLKEGMSGQAVAAWQARLQWWMKYDIAIDGNFGPATTAATKKFQTQVGLEPNGVVSLMEVLLLASTYAPQVAVDAVNTHTSKVPHGGSTDTSGLATKTEVNALGDKFNRHRHQEGTTGLPVV